MKTKTCFFLLGVVSFFIFRADAGGSQCEQKLDEGQECDDHHGHHHDDDHCGSPEERFFFDCDAGNCKNFTYKGCGGNRNNFKTKNDCIKKCHAPPTCLQKKYPGKCKGSFPRYYYDSKTNECKKFIYGGCGANDNNFMTIAECEKTCKKGEHKDYCPAKINIQCFRRLDKCCTDKDCNKDSFCCEENCGYECRKKSPHKTNGIRVNKPGCKLTQCKANEEYKECGSECAEACYESEEDAKKCPKECLSGCFCKKGFCRCIMSGKCIEMDNGGEHVCKKNEIYKDCGSKCQEACLKPGQKRKCASSCEKGCFCKEGFCRINGKCVEEDDCGEEHCKANEEYEKCGYYCDRLCPELAKVTDCSPKCTSGCFCKKDFLRTFGGKCVRPVDCEEPPCGKDEEYQECGTACPEKCPSKFKILIKCPTKCVKGCFCKKGLVRSPEGKCIPPDQCKKDHECPVGEEYQECGTACPAKCSNLGKLYACADHCVKGCFCKKGLVRSDSGKCIPPKECKKVPICEQPKLAGPCQMVIPRYYYNKKTEKCEKFTYGGCDGNENNFKTLKECEKTCCEKTQCKANEEYKECGSACEEACYDSDEAKKCPKECKSGCFCKKGFCRCGISGNCIKIEEHHECPVGEEYQECGTACPAKCSNLGKKYACAAHCVKGCFCKKGLVRSDSGKCIPPDECENGKPKDYCPAKPDIMCIWNYNECCTDKDCSKGTICCAENCGNVCRSKSKHPTNGTKANNPDCKLDIPICEQRPDPGTCEGIFSRYYYDSHSGKCKKFVYGGCGGNGNNFKTLKDCEKACKKPQCKANEEYKECGSACEEACHDSDEAKKCPKECKSGCFCKKGFCRCGISGNCIKIEEHHECPVGEEYQECGTACPAKCSNLGKKYACPAHCVKGCFCKKGLVRSDSGKCIPPDECESGKPKDYCPAKPDIVCIWNYNECCTDKDCSKGTICCAENCGNVCRSKSKHPTNGTKVNNPDCKLDTPICEQRPDPGTCEGRISRYYYDSHSGKCKKFFYGGCGGNGNNFKTLKDCEKACKKIDCPQNEEYQECGTNCPETCKNLGKVVHCPLKKCVSGCFCKKGFIRSDIGKKCISLEECKKDKCSKDEVYKECGSACPRTCANRYSQVACTKPCVSGCFCKEGLLRNEEGKCVHPDECDCDEPHCPQNEEYQKCGTNCPETCKNLGKVIHCPLKKCVSGCFCKKGYIRSDIGKKCISLDECKKDKCKKNEVYMCGNACTRVCPEIGKLIKCSTNCTDGCYCKEGYLRNKAGDCVKPKECEDNKCSKDEEYQECGTACPKTCANLGKKMACAEHCVSGCFCKKGLVRDDKGKCVHPDDCDCEEHHCPQNEEYQKCGTNCPETCKNLGKVHSCPLKRCVSGCFCKKGFIRSDIGKKCIPLDECKKDNCKKNEVYMCGNACTRVCPEIGKLIKCSSNCTNGCYCKEGYLRNKAGECVKPKECEDSKCSKDEEYQECGTACPKTCANLGKEMACAEHCVSGCFCKKGLVRDDKGKCVHPDDCDCEEHHCSKDEVYIKCGTACPKTCKNRGIKINCIAKCVAGCFCKDGLVRSDSGKCITPCKCDDALSPTCRLPKDTGPCRAHVDRYYYNCISAQCEKFVYGGCKGNKNNFKTKSECEQLCKKEQCKPDEEYKECGSKCQEACAEPGKAKICPYICMKGCFCKEGLCRSKSGKCVEECEEEKCPKDEEYQKCGTACPKTCANLGKEIVCKKHCVSGCFCKKGLVRDDKGKCVHPDDCDCEEHNCKKNEVYMCGNACTRVCPEIGKLIKCSSNCTNGCYCKEGYLRNKAGNCVKPKECEDNKCSKDEEYQECGTACPKTCANLGKEMACAEHCVSGCFCKKSLVRDDKGKCVHPDDCDCEEHHCPKDEVYNKCGTACPKTCKNRGIKIDCIDKCVPGCFCKDGLVRSDSGKCITPCKCDDALSPTCRLPKDTGPCRARIDRYYYNCKSAECEKFVYGGCKGNKNNFKTKSECEQLCKKEQCKADEVYKECGSKCQEACVEPGKKKLCPYICMKGCFCKEGLCRSKSGKCVEECEEEKCPKDEEYQKCGTACPKTCANLGKKIACDEHCVSGCFCKKGLVRDDKGKCVHPDDCDCEEHNCKKNEVYMCGNACTRVCPEIGKLIKCSSNCTNGCYCKEGYLRNKAGDCVKPKECEDNKCSKDEEYQECGTACPKTCANLGKEMACAEHCVSGCFCKKGLVRDDKGKCVHPDDCDCEEHHCPQNEEYQKCGTNCPETCKNLGKNIFCPLKKCVSGCFCKKGFIRFDIGKKCISLDECKRDKCSKDEEYQECGTACPETCANLGKKMPCAEHCVSGCFCKKGLVRDDKGKCVNPDDCDCEEHHCPKDEVYNKCGTACPKTCKNRGIKIKCVSKCVPGCFCKEGLVRSDSGKCITPCMCDDALSPTCRLPKDSGPCHAHIDRYYYNCLSAQCEKFVYGGCKGNKNNFKTKSECEQLCKKGSSTCDLDKDEGYYCDEDHHEDDCEDRFYFDHLAGNCKNFTYKGCGGNSNNFVTKQDCIKKCNALPACQQKPYTGMCAAAFPRFYYNPKSERCEEFTYGGCGANENNFETKEDCEKACCKNIQCPKDEEYRSCGTACPRTCKNLIIKILCINKCVSGCFCKGDLVRSDSGKCIPESQCPQKQCKPDEEYKECGSKCQEACVEPGKAKICSKLCMSGCFCKEGLCRSKSGKCVEECEEDHCKENEEYLKCGNACKNVCPELAKVIKCSSNCTKGCFCKEGYLRNKGGKCVKPSECEELQCPPGEEYDSCGTACEKTCKNLNAKIRCVDKCVKGCFCKKGLVRSDSGKCIPINQCPKEQCNADEYYEECGNRCKEECLPPGIKRKCAAECTCGCFCKEGLCRSESGKCVEICEDDQCKENEEYLKCGNACKNVCPELAKIIKCGSNCTSGCFCKDGYLRTKGGKCVKPSECEELQCPVDEEYDDCGTDCQVTCKNMDKKIVCNDKCVRGCFCREGLVRSDSGKCIPPSQCPQKQCKKDEDYEECGSRCEEACLPPGTARKCSPECTCGCFCKKGLCRSESGQCVEVCEEDQCKEHEEYLKCGNACKNVCPELAKIIKCGSNCTSGCFCKEGYLRTFGGKCVKPSECEEPPCPVDEEYDDCGTDCQVTCKNMDKKIVCNDKCVKGCFCREGLVRSDSGKCIPPSQCPQKQCKTDEDYEDCGSKCEEACLPPGTARKCSPECTCGCFCKKGLCRNKSGKCVEVCEEDQCKADENYEECGSRCQERCLPPGTARICTAECMRGCFCKKGLCRSESGKCVEVCEEDQCKENEEYLKCGNACKNVCPELAKIIKCGSNCTSGCFCKDGYLRTKGGKCVKPSECEELKCPIDEEYDDCGTDCQVTCENMDETIPCNDKCVRGCFCREGLVRSDSGKCIPPSQCPQNQCKANEKYVCSSKCVEKCLLPGTVRACPKICFHGCFCKEGYCRPPEGGICVDQCEWEEGQCKENEEYEKCVYACDRVCPELAKVIKCSENCTSGCFCKEGYLRNKGGKCVPPCDCEDYQCKEGEEYTDCGSSCPDTCENFGDGRICTMQCLRGCFCKKGLVRNDKGKCIPLCECENRQCPEDEEYNVCGTACPKTCENKDKMIKCTSQCVKGCFCKEGLVRSEKGKCIPPDECIPQAYCPARNNRVCIPKINECCNDGQCPDGKLCCKESCGFTCNPVSRYPTDGIRVNETDCKIDVPRCDQPPVKGPCKGDIVRYYYDRKTGDCKTFSYGGCQGNDNNFKTLKDCQAACKKVVSTCDLKKDEGEYCDYDYSEDDCEERFYFDHMAGNCKTFTYKGCGGNANNFKTKEDCVKKCNALPTCQQPSYVGTCRARIPRYFYNYKTEMCELFYYGGCNGNDNNFETIEECERECKKVQCKENEEYLKCGYACDRMCPDLLIRSLCAKECTSGCFCKKGYLLSSNGKCVLPVDCEEKKCPVNEEFLKCGTACPPTCANRGKKVIICTLQCVSGCFCKKGLVRNDRGVCVNPDDCDCEEDKCGKNEVYAVCACPETCENYDTKHSCPRICRPACVCRKGLVRSPDGKCIPPGNCKKGGSTCDLDYCEGEYCDDDDYDEEDCEERFYFDHLDGNCKTFTYRGCGGNANNFKTKEDCEKACRKVQCKAGEVYKECADPCPETCENLGHKPMCKAVCKPGCNCEEGLVRSDEGECIPPEDCETHHCNKDEVYSNCGAGCQATCESLGKPKICPAICMPGCVCKQGLVRSDDGTCVKLENCKKDQCCEDEEYKECGSKCQEACLKKGQMRKCSDLCEKGCFCKEGLCRNKHGECVDKDECEEESQDQGYQNGLIGDSDIQDSLVQENSDQELTGDVKEFYESFSEDFEEIDDKDAQTGSTTSESNASQSFSEDFEEIDDEDAQSSGSTTSESTASQNYCPSRSNKVCKRRIDVCCSDDDCDCDEICCDESCGNQCHPISKHPTNGTRAKYDPDCACEKA